MLPYPTPKVPVAVEDEKVADPEPTEPEELAEPDEPTEPTEPPEAIEPVESVDPTINPMGLTESTEPEEVDDTAPVG
jgi:hypothetical protein